MTENLKQNFEAKTYILILTTNTQHDLKNHH